MAQDEKEIIIRRMTEEDISRVKAIDESLTGSSRALSWEVGAEIEVAVYRPALSFVAEVDGEVVGFILGDIRGAEYGKDLRGWIDMVGVNPRYQRSGMGRRLVERFCEVCQKNRVNAEVVIRDGDEILKGFFASLGFRRGDMINYVKEHQSTE
jgi:ribosomal protein S18 acetylase RimI-like enzyme